MIRKPERGPGTAESFDLSTRPVVIGVRYLRDARIQLSIALGEKEARPRLV